MLATTTIEKCNEIFSRFGFPQVLVSDNGGTFISEEFEKYLKNNGIFHKFSAPKYPATNGQAERYVQIIKISLTKMIDNKATIAKDLRLILAQYRSMPHCTTGKSPAELFLGRKIRGKLDLLKPRRHIEKSSENDKLKVKKKFNLNDRIIARNYNSKDNWFPGTVIKIDGKLHYEVQLDDGRVWRRHANQLSLAKELKKPTLHNDYFVSPEDDTTANVPQQSSKIVGNSDGNQSVNTEELDNTVCSSTSENTVRCIAKDRRDIVLPARFRE